MLEAIDAAHGVVDPGGTATGMKGNSLLLRARKSARVKSYLTGSITLVCISCLTLTAWARHHKPPVWSPDQAQLTKLAELPSKVSDYSIQAPPGWDSQIRGGPGKVGTEFDGPNDENSNHSFLMVMVMGLPGASVDKRTPEDFLSLRITNMKRMVNNWKPGKYETGEINGIPFSRCHFTGNMPQTGNPVEGFMYCGREGNYVCEIQGMYLAKSAAETGPLLDAAAMTFKKETKPMAALPIGVWNRKVASTGEQAPG